MLERRQKRRQGRILMALMVAGGVMGLVQSLTEQDGAGLLQGAIPIWAALLLAVLWLVSVIGGSLWYKRHSDELDQAAQIWGMAAAGSLVLLLYPIWYLFWRAGTVIEPNGHIMFGILYVVMLAAYLAKKFR